MKCNYNCSSLQPCSMNSVSMLTDKSKLHSIHCIWLSESSKKQTKTKTVYNTETQLMLIDIVNLKLLCQAALSWKNTIITVPTYNITGFNYSISASSYCFLYCLNRFRVYINILQSSSKYPHWILFSILYLLHFRGIQLLLLLTGTIIIIFLQKCGRRKCVWLV